MACKMEEIIPPSIEEMAVFGSGLFNEKDMLRYEIQIATVRKTNYYPKKYLKINDSNSWFFDLIRRLIGDSDL